MEYFVPAFVNDTSPIGRESHTLTVVGRSQVPTAGTINPPDARLALQTRFPPEVINVVINVYQHFLISIPPVGFQHIGHADRRRAFSALPERSKIGRGTLLGIAFGRSTT
jgi:hypothetical protein